MMLRISIAVLALGFSAGLAFADRIDGSWCNDKGARVEIEGPKISLSGAPSIEGQYTRHEFLYTVPAGQDHAGDQIYMRVMGDEDMTSYTVKDGQGVDPVAWKRCAQTS
jgi:hypothetical protein